MNKTKLFTVLLLCTLLSGLFSGCQSVDLSPAENNISSSETAAPSAQGADSDGLLKVEYIDVGQADSILISTPTDEHMLIDAGAAESNDANPIEKALEAQNIDRLDVVVATHPHYDHIGRMDYVIENYDIDNFYLPDVEGNYTSATYENMLEELEEYNVNTIYPSAPEEFTLGEAKCEILSPLENQERDCNEYSIVLRMTYGDNTFLFTGDAGRQSEYNMIDRGFDLSADVLKVGHHGSAYSSTREFLDEVRPEYAVISCGEGNSYGHPHDETMDRLRGIKTYITKDVGDIYITSDGENLSVYTENEGAPQSGEYESAANPTDEAEEENAVTPENSFVGNKNSKVVHSADCGSLPKEENRVYFSSLDEAEAAGYRGHSCVG